MDEFREWLRTMEEDRIATDKWLRSHCSYCCASLPMRQTNPWLYCDVRCWYYFEYKYNAANYDLIVWLNPHRKGIAQESPYWLDELD
jgi:hypothetical protein